MDFAPPTLFLYCYRFAYSHLEVEGQPLVLDDYVIYKPTEDFPVELVSRVHSIYGFEDIFYSLRFGYATFFSRLYFQALPLGRQSLLPLPHTPRMQSRPTVSFG